MARQAKEGIARKQRPTRKDAKRAYHVPAVPVVYYNVPPGSKARGRHMLRRPWVPDTHPHHRAVTLGRTRGHERAKSKTD